MNTIETFITVNGTESVTTLIIGIGMSRGERGVAGGCVGVAFNVGDEMFDLFEDTFLIIGLFVESTVIELGCKL